MSYQVTLDALGTSYSIPSAGQTNYVNDLSLYLRDLATAVNDAGSGGGGGGTSPVFNVKTYGATGNGSTNDTTAILSAMAALALNGVSGGTLYFPAGTYVTSQTLQFGVSTTQRNVYIVGDGASSIIKPTGAFSTSAVVEFRNSNHWGVSYITIDASARTGTGDNLLIDGSSFGFCYAASLINSTRYGVNVTQINGSGPSTYNTVDGNFFSSNTSSNTHLTTTSTAVGNVTNPINGSPPIPYTINVQQRFGVAADGTTDDTTAIQAALDFGYNEVVAGRMCALLFPPGEMKITSTLVWKGNSATTPAIIGAIPTGIFSNSPYSRFLWYGADQGEMMYGQSTNCALMRSVAFDGRSIASCTLHLAASLYASPTTLAAASGIRIEGCLFQKVKKATVGNAAVKLGTDPMYTSGATWQLSDVRFDNCTFFAENAANAGELAAMKAAGVKQLQGGNCKLFSYNYCQWGSCNIACDFSESSGPIVVLIAEMSNCRIAFKHGSGSLNVIGGDIECTDVDDFLLLDGGTTIGNIAHLQGIECAAYMAGALGVLVIYGGNLTLEGCPLLKNTNYSVSGDPLIPNPYKLVVDDGAGTPTTGTFGSCRSIQNWYYGCGGTTGYAPFFDGSGNSLAPIPHSAYGGEHALRVSSQDDLGGTAAANLKLGDFDSSDKVLFSTRYNGAVSYKTYPWADAVASGTLGTNFDNAQFLIVDATSNSKTVNVPTAVGRQGVWYTVKKTDAGANTITLDATGAETIDGAGTSVIGTQWQVVTILSNGTNWFVTSAGP